MDMNMNQGGPQNDAEKSQAGTNLVIVILVLVIVVAGVKLLMSSNSAIAPESETAATSTTMATGTKPVVATEEVVVTPVETVVTKVEPTGVMMPVGKGEVAFSVLSKDAVAVRAIFVHNPYRRSAGDAAWVQIYDGYKVVPAGQATLVYAVSLAAIQYDKVKVRTLNVATGIPDEVVKQMPITVTANEKSLVTIEI